MGSRLAGKVAVVTGGGRGIGRAIALLMAEEGASVVVNDLGCDVDGHGHSREPADATVQAIKAKGGKAIANHDDMSKMASGEAVVKAALDQFSRLDVLVNATAITRDRMIHQMAESDWDAIIANNLKAAFTATKHAGIVFRQQRSGHIITLTSDAGLGSVGRSNYAAASEGLVGFTRTAARDVGRYGVTANAISPMAKTRLFPGTVEEYRALEQDLSFQQRAGIGEPVFEDSWQGPGGPDDPENVAPLAVYLATEAAAHVNGYVFGVRGGDIFLYSNPVVEKVIYKWGPFTLDELESLVPRFIAPGIVV